MISLPHHQYEPTPSTLRSVEDQWLALTNNSMVFWCGRGATALYWAFRVIRAQHGNPGSPPVVLLPSIVCQSVARAALLAGLTPRFVDIDPETGLLSLDHLGQKWTNQAAAVVFVDLYGQTADLASLKSFCNEKKLVLIEDAAHSLGGHYPDGRPIGSMADMTIFSFNRTKIIECGGGALLIKSHSMANQLQRVVKEPLNVPEEDLGRLGLLEETEKLLEKGLCNLYRLRTGVTPGNLYAQLSKLLESIYIRPMIQPDLVATVWNQIPDIVHQRSEKARLYHQGMKQGPWQFLRDWAVSGCCWRFSFLFDRPELLLTFVDRIRGAGCLVSTLYWPLNDLYGTGDECTHADRFARRIVNVCVDHTVSCDWVKQKADSIFTICNSLVDGAGLSKGKT